MPRFSKLSLSFGPFFLSLFVIVALGLFIGSFWAVSEYQAYRESVANIRENFQQQYRMRVKEESLKIIDFIEYKRSQQESLIEMEIRDKVQSAYSIASHIYSLYRDQSSTEELRLMVVELLRPIRWDNGLGYYFAGRISEMVLDLMADKPQYEGVRLEMIDDSNLRQIIGSIIDALGGKEAAQLNYTWSKPDSRDGYSPKISFVKRFEPFDWFIGAGIYVDEMQTRIQDDVLDRLSRLGFGMNGEVMVFRRDGTILCSKEKDLKGRSILSVGGAQGGLYGEKLLSFNIGEDSERFFEYDWAVRDGAKSSRRLGYMTRYKDWGWIVVTSISMIEMEKTITEETATYRRISFQYTTLFIVLFILAVSTLLLISYFYSLQIKRGIDHFTEFFCRAVDSKARVEKKELKFKEFEILGDLANRMNSDRLAKEQVIRRDELRLDTLLQLGLMENSGLQELFEFTLLRVAEITDSKGGYIVTIAESNVTIQAQAVQGDKDWIPVRLERTPAIKYDTDLRGIINKHRFVLENDLSLAPEMTCFPIDSTIKARLDVPVFEDGKIVAILGVCNREKGYGEDEKRQVSLLLDGMWLHITKVKNHKEMARLRRLLRNITDSMPSMIIGVDSDFRIMQWNRMAQQQLGMTADEVYGRLLGDVLPRISTHEKEIRNVISGGEQTEIRRVPVPGENGTRYESITIYPLRYEEIQGAVLRFDDVTEWVAMEEMMIQSEKMLSVGGLAAGIAHEINNPLASVIQNLQVIKKRFASGLPANFEAAEAVGVELEAILAYLERRGIDRMLNNIGQDAGRAAKLVYNMLAFSRKSASMYTACDLRKLLDTALEFGLADYDLKKKYDFKHIWINKEYQEDMANVVCEETNMQQVFLNIIRNAAHAITENRKNIETPQITLRVLEDGDMARVEIEDNGIGMDNVTGKKIFEPFFTTKGVGKGTGLGLSIAYFIISEQHGGTLTVQSRPGEGSRFVIRLPFTRQPGEDFSDA